MASRTFCKFWRWYHFEKMHLHFLWKCVLVWASLCLNLQIQVLYKISRKSINTFWNILCKWDCKLFGIKFKVAFKKCGSSLRALWWKNLWPYETEYGAQNKQTNQSPVEPPPGYWYVLVTVVCYYLLLLSFCLPWHIPISTHLYPYHMPRVRG